MKVTENLQEFYRRLEIQPQESISQNTPHINVFERGDCKNLLPYSRRDYYKVTLVIGEGRVEYADKTIHIDKPALLFSNPTLPIIGNLFLIYRKVGSVFLMKPLFINEIIC
jgi:hypothetical protein